MKQTVFKSIVERLYDGFFNKQEEEHYIELEKQQMKQVWMAADQNMHRQFSSSAYKPISFEQYYKENYE
jgi:hypothetical protein